MLKHILYTSLLILPTLTLCHEFKVLAKSQDIKPMQPEQASDMPDDLELVKKSDKVLFFKRRKSDTQN